LTIYLFVVVVSAVVAVFAYAITERVWAACVISTLVPVVPVVAMGWHHVEHWYSEPVQFLALALASSVVVVGVIRMAKSQRESKR
jgi:hypothetical protein